LENLYKEIDFPDEGINMKIQDYSKLVCSMLDVPIHKLNSNNSVIEALHVVFTLYSEFKDNPHFHRGNSNKIDNFQVQSMKFE
jgi:intraflagellar transport protein 46